MTVELNDGEFTTSTNSGLFEITIEDESDLSLDGGHTFETTANTFALTREEAEALVGELNLFVLSKQ